MPISRCTFRGGPLRLNDCAALGKVFDAIDGAWLPTTHDAYDENGVGGFTSDLSTSMFDFFFPFFASFFIVLASFFAFFDPLSCFVIASPCTFYLCLFVFAAAT